jgi:hypothetical protein
MSHTGPEAIHEPTFRKIEARLRSFSPPIELREHLVPKPSSVADLEVHPLTLQGVDFTVRDPDKFVAAMRQAKTAGASAFAEGSTTPSDWKRHWAMTASLLATRGIGFREPWRYYLNDRDMRLPDARPPGLRDEPQMSSEIAGTFGIANTLNLSALHISVAFGKWTECNVHIDETGVAMVDEHNNLTITPFAVHHLFNELIFKTIGGEHLPTWFVDRVNLHVLSPEMGFKRLGVSIDLLKGETYKLTISASCGLTSCRDIDYSQIIKLNRNALGSLNPAVVFTKHF